MEMWKCDFHALHVSNDLHECFSLCICRPGIIRTMRTAARIFDRSQISPFRCWTLILVASLQISSEPVPSSWSCNEELLGNGQVLFCGAFDLSATLLMHTSCVANPPPLIFLIRIRSLLCNRRLRRFPFPAAHWSKMKYMREKTSFYVNVHSKP